MTDRKRGFPTQAEVLRFLANALDLGASNSEITRYIKYGDIDFRSKWAVIEKVFTQPLEKSSSRELAAFCTHSIDGFLKQYIQDIVCKVRFDAVSRKDSLEILCNTYFPFIAAIFLKRFHEKFKGPEPLEMLLKENSSCLDSLFKWLEKNNHEVLSVLTESKVPTDIKSLNNDILSWRRGKHQPQLGLLIEKLNIGELEDKGLITSYFYLARAIDWARFKNGELGVLFVDRLNYYLTTNAQLSINEIESAHSEFDKRFSKLNQADDDFKEKYPYYPSNGQAKAEYEKLVKLHHRHDQEGYFDYRLGYFKVLANPYLPPEEKLCHLVRSFEESLYKAGESQEFFFKLAFGMATKKKSQKAIATKLKNQAIAFGWMGAPAEYEHDSSRSELLYKTESVQSKQNNPAIIISAIERNFVKVKQLLNKGNSIDVESLDGKSLLLIAIEQAAESGDNQLFKLISSHKRSPSIKTLNKRDSLGHTPLVKAVQYGRLDLVSQLIDWGADINLKGAETARSPLMLAIEKLLGVLNPERIPSDIQFLKNIEPSGVEKIRRSLSAQGRSMSNADFEQFISRMDTPEGRRIFEMLKKTKPVQQNITEEKWFSIIKFLLENGANPNQIHDQPIKGHTPVMLAAETDHLETFCCLLKHGGDIERTYMYPETLEPVNSIKIAEYFKSNTITFFINSVIMPN